MSKSIRIEQFGDLKQKVETAAETLRFLPEAFYRFAAGNLAAHVKRHGQCIAPLSILPPETDSVLRRAIRATGFPGEAPDLAEHLLADAVKRFKAGDYSLITNRSRKAAQAKRRAQS